MEFAGAVVIGGVMAMIGLRFIARGRKYSAVKGSRIFQVYGYLLIALVLALGVFGVMSYGDALVHEQAH